MDEELIFIEAKESGERIDALLARHLDGFSRTAIQRLIQQEPDIVDALIDTVVQCGI